MKEIPIVPLWRQPLARTLYKTHKKPESRYFQLATACESLGIANRTVVFRGFDESSRVLVITDTRTAKWSALKKDPKAAICWYFTDTREQYRLSGKATLVAHDSEEHNALLTRYWHDLSNAAKCQFLWGTPGERRDDGNSLRVSAETIPDLPPSHFCLLAIDINHADYLNLRGDPQQRIRYTLNRQKQWRAIDIIP
ncbi:pyridoxamine 5'-phosphate oxidase family protein [Alteromonas oceanisediminis]|uniref:pyridoxamine 5'-phosphate oxidase family protein n=1 Tax=Alteromonas oceanisediminis TaxID=2836180 RepID=UPI001BDA95AB|nr:pyridoxamine 5'-phosphate oxidase family protein [Alteromonas oceanisediminis]MBT0586427.1 pyridoxamine 5'-phosphate oxidase family protein [Alteromonas oceanisediminis]